MKPEEKWEKTKQDYNEKLIIAEETEINEEETEKMELTEEEKQKIKKQITYLFFGVFVTSIILIVFLFIPKLKSNKKIETTKTQEVEKQETLPDGDIDINNKIIQEINRIFNFETTNPLYEQNILKLFNAGKTEVKDLDFQTKMLLITSTKEFENYMTKKLKEYEETNIVLTTKELETISKEIFGQDIGLEYENFQYYLKNDKEEIIYFNAILENDKYTFAKTQGKESSIKVHVNLIYAYKIGTTLYIQYQTLFEKDGIIYWDKGLTKKIGNNLNNISKYMVQANTHSFVYQIAYGNNRQYYFEYTIMGT